MIETSPLTEQDVRDLVRILEAVGDRARQPHHEGDEEQADLESEFVYDILMKQNNGFIILHEFVKDALLQKNGIIKCFVEEKSEIPVVVKAATCVRMSVSRFGSPKGVYQR